jgi:cytochrome c556
MMKHIAWLLLVLLTGLVAHARAGDAEPDAAEQLHRQRIEQLQEQMQPHLQEMEKLAKGLQEGQIDVQAYSQAFQSHAEALGRIQEELQTESLRLHQLELRKLRRQMQEEQARAAPDARGDGAAAEDLSTEVLIQQYHAALMQHALWQAEVQVRRQLNQIAEEEYDGLMSAATELQERQREIEPHVERLAKEYQRQMLAAAGIAMEEPPQDPQKVAESRTALLQATREIKAATDKAPEPADRNQKQQDTGGDE